MLGNGIIEPSKSEWANPIVMVRKSDGKYRFCIDFRKVNKISKKDAYPLPQMTGILDKLRAARYISTVDLSQAYHQIPLEKSSREVTVFSVPRKGHYQFTRMPYGLTGAPATFQRLLDHVIGPEFEPHAFAYLDDIVVATATFEEHLKWLGCVFQRIRNAGLTINKEKSEFCRTEVRYLGFRVEREGLKVDPAKIQPVVDYPAPTNLRQLRRFIGMSSWYRKFIKDFATVVEPLTRLLKKQERWRWSEEQQSSFEQIRDSLTRTPILTRPDIAKPFCVQTDASSVGLGAVLAQTIDGAERVVAYASRALTDAEKRYSATECLAVVWAIRKFRPYLEGYSFTVVTDHHSLRWLHSLRNPTGRLARWALELLEYDYEIIHRKGALHHVPDALSRIPEQMLGETVLTASASQDAGSKEPAEEMETTDQWYIRQLERVKENPSRFPHWRIRDGKLYMSRPRKIISDIVEDTSRWKLVLPREKQSEVLRESHDHPQSGHMGIEKTFQRIAVLYYWPRLFRDVVAYVRRCETCQKVKPSQQAPAGLMGRRNVGQPWEVVAADIMGPFPRSRAEYN